MRGKNKSTTEQKETMDRIALKAIASQLKEAGAPIKVLKSDTDDALQLKVNESLHQIPSAAASAQLDSIIPEKLAAVLKLDCLGVFIDLSDVSCVRCKDVQACAHAYLDNIQGDKLEAFKPAMITESNKKVTAAPEVVDAQKKVKVTYEPDRILFVKNMKNPNPKGSEEYATLQVILDEVPGTLSELREIVARDYEQTDKEFLRLVRHLREVGMVKLDIDLTEENKAELRAAGVEI